MAYDRPKIQSTPCSLVLYCPPNRGNFKGAPRSLLDDEVREWLASASEVVANITGGTAFMGYVVQQLAHEASRFGRPVRPCVLIDRRPEVVQEAEPYVEGEVHWLQGRGGQGAWEPRHEEPL